MANLSNDPKQRLGIWIDHKEAVLVSISGGEAGVSRIESNAPDNVRPKGGHKSGGTAVAQSVSNEQRIDERRKHQLKDYYELVLKKAASADEIYIFGPGGAKNEFVGEFKKSQKDRITAVETSDSMTENQIVAKVKAFFSVSEERYTP